MDSSRQYFRKCKRRIERVRLCFVRFMTNLKTKMRPQMTPIVVESNTIVLPEEAAKAIKGKTVIPIITDEGVLLKTTKTHAVRRARGMLKNRALSVDAFLTRKREDARLER
jgi:hypothetical protein